MQRYVRSLQNRFLLFLSSVVCFSVFASEDDRAVDRLSAPALADEVHVGLFFGKGVRHWANAHIDDADERQFEEFIFSRDGSAELGDKRINTERDQAINALDCAVRLTDNQKRKFDLAGQIDRRRFFNRVHAARQNFYAAFRTMEVQTELMQLRAKTCVGLLGSESFFMKSIPVILNSSQLAVINERKHSLHIGLIKSVLRDFESRLTLNEYQRESLVKIMFDQIPYAPTNENSEFLSVSHVRTAVMKYRVSRHADHEIESLFAPVEWQKVQPLLKEWYNLKEHFVELGLLDPEPDVLNVDDPTIRFKEPK